MRTGTRLLTGGAVLAVVALVLAVKYAGPVAGGPDAVANPDAPLPLEPVPASYEPSVPGIPRLAALGAGACVPCRAMAPIRAELRREYAGVLAVDFYDVWKDPAAGRHFRIWAIPTLIFYDAAGRDLGRRQGFVSKAEILTAYDQWGVTLLPARTR